jgi:hypothetical protein
MRESGGGFKTYSLSEVRYFLKFKYPAWLAIASLVTDSGSDSDILSNQFAAVVFGSMAYPILQ